MSDVNPVKNVAAIPYRIESPSSDNEVKVNWCYADPIEKLPSLVKLKFEDIDESDGYCEPKKTGLPASFQSIEEAENVFSEPMEKMGSPKTFRQIGKTYQASIQREAYLAKKEEEEWEALTPLSRDSEFIGIRRACMDLIYGVRRLVDKVEGYDPPKRSKGIEKQPWNPPTGKKNRKKKNEHY